MRKHQPIVRSSAIILGVALAIGGGLVQPTAAVAAPGEMALTQYVNTLIGTAIPTSTSGYQGNVAPGAQVPFGMVNFGPDMTRSDYNGSGGYKIGAAATSGTINFFSLTHLNGPGCPGGGVVGMMPASTARSVSTAAGVPQPATFQTASESVSPGYYSAEVATSTDPKVKAEFTSTNRTGMARFTYPSKDSGYYSLDTRLNATSNASGTRGKIAAANVGLTVSPDGTTLSGKTVAPAFCTPWGTKYTSNVYFYAKFDKALRTQAEGSTVNTVANGSAVLQYDLTDADPTLTMRVGISSVSVANAQLNLETENPSSTFDQVRAAADADWNTRLNTVQIDQAADPSALSVEQRNNLTKFYTALYRVFVSPTTYSDVNGEYRSMKSSTTPTAVDTLGVVDPRDTEDVDNETFTRLDGTKRTPKVHYSGLSMWDTYRSAASALTLFAPDVSSEVMQSLVADAKQCGAFPHWVDNSDDSVPMAGDNALAVLAASHAFGATDFDVKAAARLVKQSVFDPTSNCTGNLSSPNMTQYLTDGYRPNGTAGQTGVVQGQSASNNIERNAADHAAGMFLGSLPAQVLWDPSVNITDADIAKLNDRSTWWKNIFNSSTGKLAGRMAPTTPGTLGDWDTNSSRISDMFHESSEPNYFWSFGYAWQDLIDAIGGKDKALTRLNTLFSIDNALTVTPTAKQLNGGQSSQTLYIGNEPALPSPWAFNWAGKPDATQYVLPQIMKSVFTTGRDGLPGNDDFGATSSFYVFAALGMFPVAQAHGGLALSTPQFPAMTVHFGDRTLRIETDAAPATAPFIQSMKINGNAQDQSWVSLTDLLSKKDGTLSYNLSATPTGSWATGDPTDAAKSKTSFSLSAGSQVFGTATPATATAVVVFSDGASQPGTVEFRSGSNVIGRAALGKGGTATAIIPAATPVGAHNLTATFVPTSSTRVGDSTSASLGFTVTALPVTDKSVLQSVTDAAAGLSNAAGTYTADSWSALQAKVTAANTVLGDAVATQPQIDTAVTQLTTALAGLRVASPVADKSVLQSVYDGAFALSNTDDAYTAASWSALQNKMVMAQTVLGMSSATQAEIDAAVKDLTAAVAGLVISSPVPDKAVLQSAYDSAKGLSNGAGKYTSPSWDALQAKVEAAKTALDNGSATQAEIDAAVNDLTAAVSGLEIASPVPDKSVLQSVYGGGIAGLSNANGKYTAASWSALQAKRAAAKAVLDKGSATQAEIDAAVKNLNSALAGLVIAPPVVAKVKLNQAQLRLVKGKSFTLEDAVYYTDASVRPAYVAKTSWASSNTKIATVSSNGVVKAKKTGTVTITVTALEANAAGKKLSTSIKVTVVKSKSKSKVTKVVASVPQAMKVGQVFYITGKYASSKATGVRVAYSTSKTDIVLIDKAGRMVAVSKGTEYVKVTAGGKTKTYKITVS